METILAQTVTDWELIICDSYSDDGSWEFFQKYKGDPRIRLYQVPREGIYAGWNECLRRVRGEYVYIATSDDTMRPDCLEKLSHPLDRFADLDLAVCDFEQIDHQSVPLAVGKRTADAVFGNWMTIPSRRNGKTEFLINAATATIWGTMAAVLFRKKMLRHTGFFRTDLGSTADCDWTLRACLASDIAWVPGKLATFRRHEKQATPLCLGLQQARPVLLSLQSVLNDLQAGIPPAWQAVSGWREHILKSRRWEYLDAFNLYRSEARRSPTQFLRNAWAALCTEPRWLLSQSLRGFSRPRECHVDHCGIVHELIRLFQAPWPPQKIGRDWEVQSSDYPPNNPLSGW